MADRILGMGDIVSLVERAQEQYDEEEAKRLQKKIQKNQFDFNDFLAQIHQIKKMGNLKELASMIPGVGKAIKDMPYAFSSPEWSNEKGLDASLAFRLFGVDSYHCVEPPAQGSTKVENFLKRDTKETLGAVMHVNVDPIALGKEIVADIEVQRQKLGWN